MTFSLKKSNKSIAKNVKMNLGEKKAHEIMQNHSVELKSYNGKLLYFPKKRIVAKNQPSVSAYIGNLMLTPPVLISDDIIYNKYTDKWEIQTKKVID